MEAYYSQALSLPLYYDLTTEDVKRVVDTLKDILVEERRKKHPKKPRSSKGKT
jgi:RNA binding exosome subunit